MIFVISKDFYLEKKANGLNGNSYVFRHPVIEDYSVSIAENYVYPTDDGKSFVIDVFNEYIFVFEKHIKVPGRKFKRLRVGLKNVIKLYGNSNLDNYPRIEIEFYSKKIELLEMLRTELLIEKEKLMTQV